MDIAQWWSTAGLGGVLSLVFTALWRGWVIPRPTARREQELQDKINALVEARATAAEKRADGLQADLARLAAEVTKAAQNPRSGVPS